MTTVEILMGILLSINNASNQLTNSQKLFRYSTSGSNEIIIDPTDFRNFIKTFRGLQWKKEDSQIELRNIVLEWKSRLRVNEETKEIRSEAYELIETIEKLHDEQDDMMESENLKLDILTREKMRDNKGDERITCGEYEDILDDEGEFDEMKKEIWRRRQYLQVFNNHSTSVLKLALVDIEACQTMVDISKDFNENESWKGSSTEEEEEEEEEEDTGFPV